MADFLRELAQITGHDAGRGVTTAAIAGSNAFFSFPEATEPHNGATDL